MGLTTWAVWDGRLKFKLRCSLPPFSLSLQDMAVKSSLVDGKALVWVNPVPMECGMMSAGGGEKTIPRFSLNVSIKQCNLHSLHSYYLPAQQLKKLTIYARNKGKHAFPWLRYIQNWQLKHLLSHITPPSPPFLQL